MSDPSPEPWLRGPLRDVHPLIMPVLFSFQQVREDLRNHTAGVSDAQVWQRPSGLSSLGFHLRHMAGSIDRLMTYLRGEVLLQEQLEALREETAAEGDLESLLLAVETSLAAAESHLRALDIQTIYDARAVGRQKLATTVVGLLVHVAEHTQRHLGQAITTAKLLKQSG